MMKEGMDGKIKWGSEEGRREGRKEGRHYYYSVPSFCRCWRNVRVNRPGPVLSIVSIAGHNFLGARACIIFVLSASPSMSLNMLSNGDGGGAGVACNQTGSYMIYIYLDIHICICIYIYIDIHICIFI
jgi:hypothetical protein